MSPWVSHIVLVTEHTPESTLQQFCFCIVYRKVNSLLPAVSTKKGTFTLMPLPKIEELCPFNRSKVPTKMDLKSGYYHIKLDEEYIPTNTFPLFLENLSFYDFHLVYPKAQISLSILFMTSLEWTRSAHKVKVVDIS